MASGLIGKLFNCDANGNYKVTQPPAPVVTTPKVLLTGGQSLSLTNPNGGLFGEVAGKRCVSFRIDNTIPCFNLFPNKPWSLRVYITSLLKTLWEKEKMLVTSIFSCSHSVFYSIQEINHHFSNIHLVVCKCFQFGLVQISVGWEWVKTL